MESESLLIKMLKDNLTYKSGETITLIEQLEPKNCEVRFKKKFDDSKQFCDALKNAMMHNQIPFEYLTYTPEVMDDGAEGPGELINQPRKRDIVIMPTVFSLTHTAFRKSFTDSGSRIASMPGFTLEMLPVLSAKREELVKVTQETYEQLATASGVLVKAEETYMYVPIRKETVDKEFGIIDRPGMFDNLPGAEVYAVPTSETRGFFTIPKGFGGPFPLPCKTKFIVSGGKITNLKYDSKYESFFNEIVKPVIFGGENYNVLAELGIGTNPAATVELIEKIGWNDLLAEKIYKSVHFANGNSKSLGGDNDVQVHNDWVVPNAKIDYIL